MFTKGLFSLLAYFWLALANTAVANVYNVNTIASIDGLNTKVPPRVVKNFNFGQKVYVLVTIQNATKQSSPKRLMVKWHRCEDVIREREIGLNDLSGDQQSNVASHVWFWIKPDSYGSARYKADVYADDLMVGSTFFSVLDSEGRVNSCNRYVVLNEKALFNFGGSQLNMTRLNTGAGSVDELIGLVHKRFKTVRKIEVIGYSDEMETSSSDSALSLNRAEAVKSLLVHRGVHADRIVTSGLGIADSVVVCSQNLSRAQRMMCLAPNRRVELRIDGELK